MQESCCALQIILNQGITEDGTRERAQYWNSLGRSSFRTSLSPTPSTIM